MEEKSLLGVVAAAGGVAGGAATAFFAANKRLGEIMDVAASAGSQKFEVSKETVLKAIKAISHQRRVLQKQHANAKNDLMIPLAGSEDVINSSVVEAWNKNLVLNDDSYAERVDQYVASLGGLLDQLCAAAKEYDYTDEEVDSAMRGQSAL